MSSGTHVFSHAAPGQEVCDFCSAPVGREPSAVWTYQTEPHEYGTRQVGGAVTHFMDQDGLWAACNACHALIEAGDRRAFLRHCATRLAEKSQREHPEIAAVELDVLVALIMDEIRVVHQRFFAHRTAQPPWRGATEPTGS